jgi:hypothetical protein
MTRDRDLSPPLSPEGNSQGRLAASAQLLALR